MPRIDLQNRVGVIFTTIHRDAQARATVRSVRETFDNVAIYVSDQNPPTDERVRFYQEHAVRVRFIAYDSGLSYGRNCLLGDVREEFILLIDDDNIFDARHNVQEAVAILDHDPEVCIVGGRHENVVHAADGAVEDRFMKEPFDYLISYDSASGSSVFCPAGAFGLGETRRTPGGVSYRIVQVVENFALMRRSLFDDPEIRWDDGIKIIGEHLDFYLTLARHPRHKVAFNERMILQNHIYPAPEYHSLRNRSDHHQRYAEKWGIRHEIHLGKRLRFFDGGAAPLATAWQNPEKHHRVVRRVPYPEPAPVPADPTHFIEDNCSFICTTLERFECVKTLTLSLRRHLGDVPIHCALQCDGLTDDQKAFAARYGLDLVAVPYDHGLSASRNALVRRVKTKYFVLCDDDFIFDRHCRLQDPVMILEACPDVAIVGGHYREIRYDVDHNVTGQLDLHFEFLFNYDAGHGFLTRIPLSHLPIEVTCVNGVDFVDCDCVNNVAVFRTEIFRDPAVRWDDDMKICGEHLDFYLTLREKTDLRVVYCPSFSIQHNRRQNVRYRAMRGRTQGMDVFDRKWGIKRDIYLGRGIRRPQSEGIGFDPIPNLLA